MDSPVDEVEDFCEEMTAEEIAQAESEYADWRRRFENDGPASVIHGEALRQREKIEFYADQLIDRTRRE